MKKGVFVVIFVLTAIILRAQESQEAYSFLRLPVSAHVAALGGDNITINDDDPTLIFHNPALIAGVTDKSLNLNYMTYMEGCKTASASFVKAYKERATWGVSAQYMDYGKMKQTTVENIDQGEFSAKDIALGGYFSYLLTERITGGITAKFIYSAIADYHSMAVGVDLGLNYFDEVHEWSASIVAKNLGGQVKAYDDVYDRMPFDLQAGVTKRLVHTPLRFSLTLHDLGHWDYKFIQHVAVGADVILSPQIWLAVGYNFRRAHQMSILSSLDKEEGNHGAGLTLGAGLSLQRFKLGVAYGKYHVSSASILINAAYTL